MKLHIHDVGGIRKIPKSIQVNEGQGWGRMGLDFPNSVDWLNVMYFV